MFTIRLRTLRYRPDLQITIRTSAGNWQDDLAGNYENDEWVFRLPIAQYGGTLVFKFVLEEQYWMFGPDLFLQPQAGGNYIYEGAQVTFPPVDELVVEAGYVQQKFFEPNFDEGKEYDAIVIGSGIGGGILADQLTDLGLEVLVLDAGSYLFPTHVGNLPRQHRLERAHDKNIWALWDDFKVTNYQNAPGSNFNGAQAFALGGRSLFWGGFIPRMSWWELEPPWPQAVRWALENDAYAEAEQLLKKSEVDSDFQRRIRSELRGRFPDYVPLIAPMAIQHSFSAVSAVPAGVFSTADLLMESRLTAGETGIDNLTINLNHAVVEILKNGNRATGVVAHDLISDRRRTFRGRYVILAAGTIESAKIAKLSGLADPNNKIGVGITDHPIFFVPFVVSASSPLYDRGGVAKLLLRHRDANRNAHRYNVLLEIGSDFNQGRFIDPEILEAHLAVRGDAAFGELVFLFHSDLIEQNELVQNGPSFAKPVVRVNEGGISQAEWNEVQGLTDQIMAMLHAQPFAPGTPLTLGRAGLGGVAHEVGTLRIGTVVDENLKFLAYDNLYACDLSIFPTSPAANPTLTLAALALRLATHLRARVAGG